jgi:hypothetical protein
MIYWPPKYTDTSSRATDIPTLKLTIPSPRLFISIENREKQQTQFFILRCLTKAWFPTIDHGNCFTHQYSMAMSQWRDVLQGSFWRMRWPRVAGLDKPFQLQQFWRYGGPPFLQTDYVDPDHVPEELKPRLADGTELEPRHFEDDRLKSVIHWDLMVTQMQYYFQAVDDLYAKQPKTELLREVRLEDRNSLFRSNYDLIKETPAWETDSQPVRRAWFTRFRGFIKDWVLPKEAQLWSRLPRQMTFQENFSLMTDEEFGQYEMRLICIFYQCVVTGFRTIPPILTSRPSHSGLENYMTV